MISIVADPGPEYLERVGELAFAVTSIEGGLIFDIPRLSSVLPAAFTVASLEMLTTVAIGQRFLDVAPSAGHAEVRAYCETGGVALRKIGAIRNDVLHARPATMLDGLQRLARRRGDRTVFWVDDAWLQDALEQIAAVAREVNAVRPSFQSWPA